MFYVQDYMQQSLQQRMKEWPDIQKFLTDFTVITQPQLPILPSIISFDYTCMMTAKQIWLQNIDKKQQQDIELRNKAQQLMRVLQYQDHQDQLMQDCGYTNWESVIRRNMRLDNASEHRKVIKQRKMAQTKQIQININSNAKKETQLNSISKWDHHSRKLNTNKNASLIINKHNRDENVDLSNFGHLNKFEQKTQLDLSNVRMRSIESESILDQLQKPKTITKISQLSKREYMMKASKIQTQVGLNNLNTPNQQNNNLFNQVGGQNFLQTNQSCRANCLHIKYQCCCKDTSQQNKNVGEFKLSLSGLDKSGVDKNKTQIEEAKKSTRVCSRVQKNQNSTTVAKTNGVKQAQDSKISTKNNILSNNHEDKHTVNPRSQPKSTHHILHQNRIHTQYATQGPQQQQNEQGSQINSSYSNNAQDQSKKIVKITRTQRHQRMQTLNDHHKEKEFFATELEQEKQNYKAIQQMKQKQLDTLKQIQIMREMQNNKQIQRIQEIYKLKQEQMLKQIQKIRQAEKIKDIERARQIENLKMIELEKITAIESIKKKEQEEKLKQLQAVKQIEKVKQQQLVQIYRLRQISIQREKELSEKYRKQQQKLNEIQRIKQIQNARQRDWQMHRQTQIRKQQHEQKMRQASLLRKLKEQFSEICYHDTNEDQKRVSEQIKQLEVKLSQIISHNNTHKTQRSQFPEPHSPSAKVVKLNLTPTRQNYHQKSQSNMQKSPREVSPINSKRSRLLSKRIQTATRMF